MTNRCNLTSKPLGREEVGNDDQDVSRHVIGSVPGRPGAAGDPKRKGMGMYFYDDLSAGRPPAPQPSPADLGLPDEDDEGGQGGGDDRPDNNDADEDEGGGDD